MIYTTRTITIKNGKSIIDEPVLLYRGDYKIELRINLVGNGFIVGDDESYSYCELVIISPIGKRITSDIYMFRGNSLKFIITKEMIDDIEEIGLHTFQIRLYGKTKYSRVSLPPVEGGIEVRESLDSTNAVGGEVDSSDVAEYDAFDEDGRYIKTEWSTGDSISAGKLNKIEEGIYTINNQSTNNYEILTTHINTKSDQVSIEEFGIQSGYDVDVAENTAKFQAMIDFCKDSKVIVFPAGDFVFNSVDLGVKSNVSIKGASSSFASFAQKDIYTGEFVDKFTRIICNAPAGETFFKHQSAILILENIGFYNLKKEAGGKRFTNEEAKTNVLMQHTRSEDVGKNVEKGKAFCNNCAFFGWKVVFGSDFTMQHLEDSWNTGKVAEAYEYLKQSCVLATACRFTRNGIAINQPVDGRLVHCSFNKNDYAIVFRENSGFTTIDACRIEWNNFNGIYCEKAHEVTVSNCEFDCNGLAGLYAIENTNSNFNGIYRRSGAKIPSLEKEEHRSDYINNVHIYAKGNIHCIFMGSNTTVKPISDVGAAPERPTNCSCFDGNINCIIAYNNLCGCTKKDAVDANQFLNNIDCIITNNMLTNSYTPSDPDPGPVDPVQ